MNELITMIILLCHLSLPSGSLSQRQQCEDKISKCLSDKYKPRKVKTASDKDKERERVQKIVDDCAKEAMK